MGSAPTALFLYGELKIVAALIRKINQVLGDPTLQRWLLGRAIGRWQAEPYHRLHPPYLNGRDLGKNENPQSNYSDLSASSPEKQLKLNLAGEPLAIEPGDERSLMERNFADTESLLALHRFAWISTLESECDPTWVNALWRVWIEVHSDPDADGWAWHPYTTAERLINILAFAEQFGLPGPRERSLEVLSHHGPAIWKSLEYFGEINTGNHLTNNGRGLFLGGLGLGYEDWADRGGEILIRESRRIFAPSGILREGSSHYHLLVTRWYAECWLAAKAAGRPEAEKLGNIVEGALSQLPVFAMPGGLPLIGDVSPDCPPEYLAGLITGEKTGWLASLTEADFDILDKARRQLPFNPEQTAADGWRQKRMGKWSALWHTAPEGWSEQPGHAHHDFGSFELHYGRTPIVRDLGRRSYGSAGDQDVASEAHNSLSVDKQGPYPSNKPYYSKEFRKAVSAGLPKVTETASSVTIESNSFSRIKNVGPWRRQWKFDEDGMAITDHIDGRGLHRIERHLHTTLPVSIQDDHVAVGPVKLVADGNAEIHPSAHWSAYGRREPATSITIVAEVELPWSGVINLDSRQ